MATSTAERAFSIDGRVDVRGAVIRLDTDQAWRQLLKERQA
jgi:hypothetical protein